MKQKILFLLFFILFSTMGFAQMENSLWYFGYNAGMDFRDLQTYANATINGITGQTVTAVPKFVSGPIYTNEGCFSLCDKDGNFLMASDGSTVYNGPLSTDIMENGTGLFGGSSSTQSGAFVPRPGHPNQFYIITGTPTETAPALGLNYSIVDMSLNSGKGKVIEKNNPLDFGGARLGTSGTGALINRLEAYEGIAVYAHSNGIDYWVVNRTRDKFFTWLITKDGIGPSPVSVTQANEDGGTLYQLVTSGAANTAQIMMTKFSIDGTLLANSFTVGLRNVSANTNALLYTYIIVCKFDNSTGVVSDVTSRGTVPPADRSQNYGLEFSPNNEYLYHCIYPQVNPTAQVWKIPKANFFTTLAGTAVLSSSVFQASNIGIGPDDRLYCIGNNQRDLVIFENPDEGATNWIKIPDYFSLTNIPRLGLPNFVYSFFGINDIQIAPISPCREESVTFSIKISAGTGPNTVSKIAWDFGDGSTPEEQTIDSNQLLYTKSHTYSKRGTYTLTITPLKSDNSAITDRIQTVNIKVNSCILPVNHNISVMGYHD